MSKRCNKVTELNLSYCRITNIVVENLQETLGLTDAKLVTLSTKALNKILKSKKLSNLQMREIKKHRRKLKNRGYAASCRTKRLDNKSDLEQEKGKEYKDLDFVQEDNAQMRDEIEDLHKKFEALKRFSQQKKIGIPPELDQY